MKLLRVKFSNLYEAQGAFGYETVSPGGAGFPKHLIWSYNLGEKTIVLPWGWLVHKNGGTNENNWHGDLWELKYHHFTALLRHDMIEKVDFVEVDFDEKEFQPRKDLSIMMIWIPRRSKNRMDKLIERYQNLKIIIAQRSRDSEKMIVKTGRKGRTILEHTYELVIRKSKWKAFADELRKQRLAKERFSILVEENGVFPRQLANFNKVS